MQFVEKNIREDQQALEELLKLGFRATPVTVVDGEVVVGFDRGRIERLLGIGKPEDAAREPAPVPEAVPGQAGQVPSEAPGNRQYTRSIFGGEDGNE